MPYVIDIHTHVVPGVDDGAETVWMANKLLSMDYDQGVRHVFCTSHKWYDGYDLAEYKRNFEALKAVVRNSMPELNLHTGCELFCSQNDMGSVLEGLRNGLYLPLGNSKCVLTELSQSTVPEEALFVVDCLIADGWTPVMAHVERYPALFDGKTIDALIEKGCMMQVNAYSLFKESGEGRKSRARQLMENRQIHFIGSDTHRLDYKQPDIIDGIRYLYDHTDMEYADAVCFGNANKYLL